MNEVIDKGNKVGSLVNNWIKIAVVFGGALISCSVAYYKIFENEKQYILLKKHFDEQIQLIEARADKRYKRAMEKATKLEDFGMYHEKRILELEKGDAYMKGKIGL